MELGWILILAGIAILAFLHFSGRSRGSRSIGRGASQASLQDDALLQNPDESGSGADPYAAPTSYKPANTQASAYTPEQQGGPTTSHPGMHHDHLNPSGGYDPHTAGYPADYVNDPLMSVPEQDAVNSAAGHAAHQQSPTAGIAPGVANDSHLGFDMDPADMQRPADVVPNAGPADYPAAATANAMNTTVNTQTGGTADSTHGMRNHPPADAEIAATRPVSGFSSFLANLSGGILGKRRGDGSSGFDPLAANNGLPANGAEPMVITLHVVAPEGQIIHGPRLQSLFEQRGYHYGEMNIFHSLNQGNIVFSVAKIVEPGTFDINNPASFETPGITLILQLPAPVAANVAFDVLVSEASEMARALGCNLLDSGHSTLSRQTIQHLSDSVQQFMHRQRVAESVPS